MKNWIKEDNFKEMEKGARTKRVRRIMEDLSVAGLLFPNPKAVPGDFIKSHFSKGECKELTSEDTSKRLLDLSKEVAYYKKKGWSTKI